VNIEDGVISLTFYGRGVKWLYIKWTPADLFLLFCLNRILLLLQLGHPRKRKDKSANAGQTERLPMSGAGGPHLGADTGFLDVRVTVEHSSLTPTEEGVHLG
jgi:hypothetical protein